MTTKCGGSRRGQQGNLKDGGKKQQREQGDTTEIKTCVHFWKYTILCVGSFVFPHCKYVNVIMNVEDI